MEHSRLLITFTAIVAILPLALLASTVPVRAANVMLTPSSATVGTSVHISGDGFSGRLATIHWDKQIALSKIPISETGTLMCDLKVPAACKGSHTISITDDSNWTGSAATATFNVLPGIEIFPRIGRSYIIITVIGNGFACFEKNIKVTWDKTVVPVSAVANDLGVWSLNIEAPEAAKGEHYISAFSSSIEASEIGDHKFIVAPFAKIQPNSGPPGTEITMEGFGFRTSEDGITITWDNEIILCNLIAGFDGVVDGKLNIPAATHGHHIVGVFGSDFTPKGQIPDMDFNVTSSIQLEPASGNKGTKVTVNGKGFDRDEKITISFDGTVVNGTDIIADEKGSFSTFFMAPQSPVQGNKVEAVGAAGNSADTLFIIDKVTPPAPALLLPPPGTKLAVYNSVGDTFLGTARQIMGVFLLHNSSQREVGPSGVTFDWTDVKVQGETSYTFEIADTSDFSSPLVVRKGLVDSQYTLSGDDVINTGNCKWRVMAVDDVGNEGLWSEAYNFEVIPMSNSVFILSLIVPLVFIGGMAGLGIVIWRRHKAGL